MSIHRSLLFSSIDKYASVAIGLVTIAVLARLLTPAEIGVFMVGNAAVNLVAHFRDFGVGVFIVQEREVTRDGVRAAFTVTFALSILLAVVLCLAAIPIADFYGEPALRPIVQLATIAFLFVPFSNPIVALLRRDMSFDTIALINLTNVAVNSVIAITLAALGWGSLSLVWAAVIASAAGSLVTLWARPEFWIFRPRIGECGKVLSFGIYSSMTTLLNMTFEPVPRLILGRVLGFDAVGLYNRALLLCQLPDRSIFSALQPVVLPALARRIRVGGDLKEPYLRALGHITAIQWPFLSCLALLADPAVRIILGSQWLEVAPLVRIMAVASMCLFPALMTYPLLVAVGSVKDTLTASLISLPPSLAVVFFAAFLGLKAVAASLFLTAPFQVYVALRFIRRHVAFSWRDLAGALSKSALVTLCAAAVPAAVVAQAGFQFDLSNAQTLIAGTGAVLGWGAGLSATAHPLLGEIRNVMISALRIFRKRPA